jgi:hypothetical protein
MWEKQRKAPRIPAAEPVAGSFTNGGAHAISGVARDVSSGGTFFYCELAPELGSEIEFMLELPKELVGEAPAHVLGRGRVVRVKPANANQPIGVAVEFVSVDRLPSP